MKFVLLKLPIPRPAVRKLFLTGLAHLEGRLEFARNKSARASKTSARQPDAKLIHFIANVHMANGRPTASGSLLTKGWLGGGNFTEEYSAKLEQSFIIGRADHFLGKHKVQYLLNQPTARNKKNKALLVSHIEALDLLRPNLLAVRMARKIRSSLRFEKNNKAARYYFNIMELVGYLEPLLSVLRRETSDLALISKVEKLAAKIVEIKVVSLRWGYSKLVRSIQFELRAFLAARTRNAKLRQLDRLHVFFRPFDFKNINNRQAQRVRALLLIKKNLKLSAVDDLLVGLRKFLENPTWAGTFKDILKTTNAIPDYVLRQYGAGTRYLRALLKIGTPAVTNDLYAHYKVTCLITTKACRPDFGHYVLLYETAARKRLESFQGRALKKIDYTPRVQLRYLDKLKKLLDHPRSRQVIAAVGKIPPVLSGDKIKPLLENIVNKNTKSGRDRLVLLSRMLRVLFLAVHESGQMYLSLRANKPTVRASEAKVILEKVFRSLNIPLRKPGEPISRGWLVEITESASAGSAVLSSSRLVLLRKLKGDPPLYTEEETRATLPVHEMFHVLRAEAGRDSAFALLTSGVHHFLDFEEGLAALLERLALPRLLAERRVVQAMRYYGASLALKNISSTDERSLYSWQDIFDILGSFGVMEETYEALRRLIRMTDGRRVPKNVNLRDVVYFRGIQKIQEWIPEVFGAKIFDHIWRDDYKRKALGPKEQKEIVKKIRVMYKSKRYQHHFAAQAIVDLMNELMVGKVTPDFVRTMKQRGHYKAAMFKIKIAKKESRPAKVLPKKPKKSKVS